MTRQRGVRFRRDDAFGNVRRAIDTNFSAPTAASATGRRPRRRTDGRPNLRQPRRRHSV